MSRTRNRQSAIRNLHTRARLVLALALLAAALVLLAATLGVLLVSEVYAATLTVNTTADNESDGCGVNNCTLREAIDDACPGDVIEFSLTYPATITLTSGRLEITKTLTISGPGAGSLSISGNNASRVISTTGVVTITGVTIRDGNVSEKGGGIYNSGMLMLTNSTVYSNTAGTYGGGIFNYDGTVTLANSTVSGNTADYGGGIENEEGTVTLANCTVMSNTADGGGGIYITEGGTLTLTNSTVSGNTAGYYGGGISFATNANLIIINSTFSGNTAEWGGGAIADWGEATILSITNSTLYRNHSTASDGGGGLDLWYSTADIKNTILAGNTNGAGVNNFYGGGGYQFPGLQPGKRHGLWLYLYRRFTEYRSQARPAARQRRRHVDPRPASRQPGH
jgi:CSLREA domain-containing protein